MGGREVSGGRADEGRARERTRPRARGGADVRLKQPRREETHLLTCPSSSSRANGSAGRESPTAREIRPPKGTRRRKIGRASDLADVSFADSIRETRSFDRARRTHDTPTTDHVPKDARFRHRAARVRRDSRRRRPQGHPQGTTRGASAHRATRSPPRIRLPDDLLDVRDSSPFRSPRRHENVLMIMKREKSSRKFHPPRGTDGPPLSRPRA